MHKILKTIKVYLFAGLIWHWPGWVDLLIPNVRGVQAGTAVSARRSVLLLLCSRNLSTELVAKSCETNDMRPRVRTGRAAIPLPVRPGPVMCRYAAIPGTRVFVRSKSSIFEV